MTNSTAVKTILCAAVVAMQVGQGVIAQGNHPAAQAAAESRVALVDQEQYAASWQTAAASFKSAVPQQKVGYFVR